MISIKDADSIKKMEEAGQRLVAIFEALKKHVVPGATTADLDSFIDDSLEQQQLVSATKGFKGYRHASCISRNDEVVHGIPCKRIILKEGDYVKVDICAAYQGYHADMARPFFVGSVPSDVLKLSRVAQDALDEGIGCARIGNHLTDISAAIQKVAEKNGYGIVRNFAGHGIGKRMHEDPEILNYGKPGKGPILQAGMTFAIEPMLTMGHYSVYIMGDGWTVKTCDGSLAAHVEDTVLITASGPKILTRNNERTPAIMELS